MKEGWKGVKKVPRNLLLLIALILLVSCSGEPEQQQRDVDTPDKQQAVAVKVDPEFRSISASEAYALLTKEQDVMIIDVRSVAEHEQVRISGSVAVPFEEILQGQTQLPKDRTLLLVCAVGGRSYAAGLYLANQKYPRIYNLRGGISAWEKTGLPVEYGAE